MKQRWWVLGLIMGACAVSFASKQDVLSTYHAAYEQRMASAQSDKEIIFLTTRYDDALKKSHEQLVRENDVLGAEAVAAERKRIRALDQVIAAGVFSREEWARSKKKEKPEVSTSTVHLLGVEHPCSRPVFLLHSGPAMLVDRENPERGRVGYEVLRSRLIDCVNALDDDVEFNVALFWAPHTTAFAPSPVGAGPENKAAFSDWIAPVNPLRSEAIFGRYTGQEARAASALRWPNKLMTAEMDGQPMWLYNYQIGQPYSGYINESASIHWVRALAFAFEQKADAVFVMTPSLIVARDNDLMDIVEGLVQIGEEIYGEKELPTIHFILCSRGRDTSRLEGECKDILREFDGKVRVLDDLEDWMTDDEKDLFDSL